MQVFFILFSVHFAVYQYINSKCLYRTHVKINWIVQVFNLQMCNFVNFYACEVSISWSLSLAPPKWRI